MSKRPVLVYRWIVFLLAAGYCLRMVLFSEYEQFAGPFRYLTVWALFFSFFCASRMIALEEGRITRRFDGIVSMTSVLNAMVVFLYWRLYFADPNSVRQDGELGPIYLEMYLHLAGPLLQWIDAIFIHRSFNRIGAALMWLFGVISAYVLWAEMVLERLNDKPSGDVTSGLPYPFLNNLEFSERAVFYGSNFVVAVIFLLTFAAIRWGVVRLLGPSRSVS